MNTKSRRILVINQNYKKAKSYVKHIEILQQSNQDLNNLFNNINSEYSLVINLIKNAIKNPRFSKRILNKNLSEVYNYRKIKHQTLILQRKVISVIKRHNKSMLKYYNRGNYMSKLRY